MPSTTYKNWQQTLDADNILWLTLDRYNAGVNSLNAEIVFELDQILDTLTKEPTVAGLIIQSGKSSGFIAGADVEQFITLKDPTEAFNLIRKAQVVFDKLEALKIPTVAMIQGFCLGGGLELALACRYRIVEEGPKTQLGAPEVNLGLHPGWGGTIRLPRLIGILPAMQMNLTGRPVNAKAAVKLGLADKAVPERHLAQAARFYVLNKPPVHCPVFWQRLLNVSLLRPLVGKFFYKKLEQKVSRANYPAPYATVDNWVRYGVQNHMAMVQEAKSIAALLVGKTSRNLVRAFFLQTRLKGLGKSRYPLDLKELGRRQTLEPQLTDPSPLVGEGGPKGRMRGTESAASFSPLPPGSRGQTIHGRSLASMPSRHSVHPENVRMTANEIENNPRTSKTMGTGFSPQHVHVIGSGVMGGDIAAWCALKGLTVTLQDRLPELISPAIKRAHDLFQKKLKSPRLVQAALDRLIPDTLGAGVAHADVVIEAVSENLLLKQSIYQSVEPHLKAGAVLATNTSSLPLDELSQGLKDPTRLVGIHFFNPVAQMQLVEVVRSDKTAVEVLNQAMAFVRCIDRLPLPVKSCPGFLVNRVLMPYLMEAMMMLDEGKSPESIDQAALAFGMPMGPVELADTVGLDVCLAVADILAAHAALPIPEILRQKVAKKELGRKSGKGFYRYQKGKPLKAEAKEGFEVLTDRLILPMVNEATACLREQITTDADLIDAGLIFGTGFAPFRGGPLQYAKSEGIPQMLERLQTLQSQQGDRFKPDAHWVALVGESL